MNGKQLAEALRAGRRVYGTLLISPSPHWPQALAGAGLDFVFIDTEHIAIERTVLSWMCRTYAALDLAPVVRIPAPDPYQATAVLDGGASGLLVPYVETAAQVRRLAGAVKFRPLKGRRLDEFLAGRAALEPELLSYLEQRNAGNSLLINIESVPAIEALDDILAVPGVDAVIIGPHDLSCSLGIPEQYHHPRFEEAVRTIIRKAAARGVGAGVHAFWDSVPQQIEWARLGGNVLLNSSDLLLFRRALMDDLNRLKQPFGDADHPPARPREEEPPPAV